MNAMLERRASVQKEQQDKNMARLLEKRAELQRSRAKRAEEEARAAAQKQQEERAAQELAKV